MQENPNAFAAYWRNSLADVELGRGILKRDEVDAYRQVSRDEAKSGCINEDTINAFFTGERDDVLFIEVVYRPAIYVACVQHGRRPTHLPEIVTPLVTHARISRDGYLLPSNHTVVPRDLLQPLEAGSFSIGTVDDLDAFLTTDWVPGVVPAEETEDDEARAKRFTQSWSAYLAGLQRMLDAVCSAFISARRKFLLADYGLILKKDAISGANQHILRLYDHLRETKPSAPLFATYARATAAATEPCLPLTAAFAKRLAHSSDRFPLAAAQRAALSHLLTSRNGDILAVNGPPGTGKTTLLLSVVASLWAQAALDESDPPTIIAASTNNQAVTNIIDAFGKDFSRGDGLFGGRWLPNVESFGSYFPSRSREAEAAEKYQTTAFFEQIESEEYVDRATAQYLACAKAAFLDLDTSDVKLVVLKLHGELKKHAARLKAIEDTWVTLCAERAAMTAELGDDPEAALSDRRALVNQRSSAALRWNVTKSSWESFRAKESLLYSFFSWLPPVAAKRLRLAREFLKAVQVDVPLQEFGSTFSSIEKVLIEHRTAGERCRDEAVRSVKLAEAAVAAESTARSQFYDAATLIGADTGNNGPSFEDCEIAADTKVRFKIFLLTTHYWEGRWLIEMKDQMEPILKSKGKKNPGPKTLIERWRRRMKLTPCAVSTFSMLPSYLQTSTPGDGKFTADYLYDFADLLIVDEAGQVLPEVAGASFSLARKALVVGDTQQIEPIWSVPRHVDFGNLMNLGLLTGVQGALSYEGFSGTGKSATSGSVMRIAQQVTRYHADPELDRGLYLYEHRRCYDEIIGFCNTLCYHGKLHPRRGQAHGVIPAAAESLPPMAYVHVDGMCQGLQTGSRRNLLEAETIAAWLAANRSVLEEKYGLPLYKIVGIVTPFAGQVAAIETACAKVSIKVGRAEGQLTAGTTHSFQGAERHIVIFSSVYSKHEDGKFIDKSTSMLNVAVSRAKDSFIVFGDMDVFESVPGNEPRGKLAKYLFSSPANALPFEYRKRVDLETGSGVVSQLQDAPGHDAFLLHTLCAVKTGFQIVTPWLRLDRAREIGAYDAMLKAVARGVDVEIYTDLQLNVGDNREQAAEAKRTRLLADAKTLREAGITVNFVRQVHSKLVIGDNDIYCVGSFNWFSAQRDGPYARHETSLLYRGPDLMSEIMAMRKSLLQRKISTDP